MKRLTTKIKGSNNYCKFELKNAKYKNLFELSSNREIEDYVNSDLTIAIDKLGQLEDIEEKYNIFLKKGAGLDVDKQGAMLVQRYGEGILSEIAKLNFKNTDKIKEILNNK